jgi:hypothetical protein
VNPLESAQIYPIRGEMVEAAGTAVSDTPQMRVNGYERGFHHEPSNSSPALHTSWIVVGATRRGAAIRAASRAASLTEPKSIFV